MHNLKIKNKIFIIVQARLNSTRLPNKILKKISKKSSLLFLLERLKKVKLAETFVAIPANKKNYKLKKILSKNKINFFSGSDKNVLKRYYQLSDSINANIIVRITSDNPFSDPKLINNFIKIFLKNKLDYLSNNLMPTFPKGFDIEIFNHAALKESFYKAKTNYEKEHVTPYIRKKKSFKKMNIRLKQNFHDIRVTLDYKEDLQVIRKILKEKKNTLLTWKDIIKLHSTKPKIFKENKFRTLKSNQNFKKETNNWISNNYVNKYYN